MGSATHSMTMYRHHNGSLVFSAGTVQFSWGLDSVHLDFFGHNCSATHSMQQLLVNVLAAMGTQPTRLAPGLTRAVPLFDAAHADRLPPRLTHIQLFPVDDCEFSVLAKAEDDGGGTVAKVEVSFDSGFSWIILRNRKNYNHTSSSWRRVAQYPNCTAQWPYRPDPERQHRVIKSLLARVMDDSFQFSLTSTYDFVKLFFS